MKKITIRDLLHREITLEGQRGNYYLKIKESGKNICMFTFTKKDDAMKMFRRYKALEVKLK